MTGRSGRVRSETARVAILQATAHIFGSRGYDHLTIEGVAAEAGVGKQTIYRWWRAKGELVADALLEGMLLSEPPVMQDTGDLRADLTTWLRDVFRLLQPPGGGDDLVRSLAAAAAENADVGRRMRDSLGATSELAGRLRTGVEAGQLSGDVAVEDFGDVLVGAIVLRALARTATDEAAIERLVSVVLPR